ncbi:MAG: YeeE/YedE family protein [Alphaproteobacteria bacterium]|nr:YeeE/YedE family protein [Alphaproteobacteria bacterium]
MNLQRVIFSLFLFIGLALTLIIYSDLGYRHSLIFLVSILMGIVFYLSFFGFSGAWKKYILTKNSIGIRAQIFLILLSSLLIFPLINTPSLFFNFTHGGSFAPVGLSLIIGSFIFGAAMQVSGGCASGTLFSAGGGNIKMFLTLIFFILGSTLGTYFFEYWIQWPSFEIIKFDNYYYLVSIFFVLILLYLFLNKQDPFKEKLFFIQNIKNSYVQHRIPLWLAVIFISILSFLTIILSGHPWSITFGFSLWGSKFFHLLGMNVYDWGFWNSNSYTQKFIRGSILLEVTSLMNIGILLGSLLTSIYIGKFSDISKLSNNDYIKLILSGLALGLGARLAFGCNIGALLGGIVSGSLHGWIWLIFSFLGSYFVVRYFQYE